jgi:hypothetical protein
VVSLQRVCAYLIAFVPALEFLIVFAMSRTPIYRTYAIKSAGLALVVFFIAVACPVGWLYAKSRSYNAKVHKYFWSINVPKIVRPIGKRIEFVLDEVSALQQSQVPLTEASISVFAAFEAACILYLEGKVSRTRVVESRRNAIRSRAAPPTPLENVPAGLETYTASPDQVTAAVATEDPETLTTIADFGLAEEDARRIARRLSAEQAASMISQLKTACPEYYREIIRGNPGILCMHGRARGKYLSALYKVRQLRENASLQRQTVPCIVNPTALSTLDGLDYLSGQRAGQNSIAIRPPSEEVLLSSISPLRYRCKPLLKAILCNGFSLRTTSPKIGMSYRHFSYIRSATENHARATEMAYFIETFKNLLTDGVILTDKQYKGGGGKFSGCYSVTSSLKEIKREDLRLLVREYLYGGEGD